MATTTSKTKSKRIEKRVMDTILERPVSVSLGEKSYEVAPPTIATLIMVSEAISRMPKFELDSKKLVQESLYIAKECSMLGEILAILILGAQRISESENQGRREKRGGLLKRIFTRETPHGGADEKRRLADEILLTMSPRELFNLLSRIFSTLQLSDFFGVTTFLNEINILHKTTATEKVVETAEN